jgi:CDP-diacylglycerol--serine O-phosphatidyltransferase
MAASELSGVRKNPRRGMYVLPSLFTAGNIAAGYYAITQSIHGASGGADASTYFDHAALAIGFAVIFDGLDGRVARMTQTSSDFGREFDSLADVITFGVAPSVLAFLWGVAPVLPSATLPLMQGKLHDFGMIICFLFLISGACRLARFNVSVNPQPGNPGRPGRKYFVGMPIPAGAGVVSAVVHYELGSPIFDWRMSALWLGLIVCVGFLMVSNWRFWSGKELNFSGAQPVRSVLLMVVALAVVIWFSQYALIVMAMIYLLSGVLARLAYSWERRSARA